LQLQLLLLLKRHLLLLLLAQTICKALWREGAVLQATSPAAMVPGVDQYIM
jgi:hypothetical protein